MISLDETNLLETATTGILKSFEDMTPMELMVEPQKADF